MKRKLQITSLISKAAADVGLTAVRDIVSDQIAIDMGSSSTRIWVSGHGLVVDEPSAIAVETTTGEVLAVGLEAQKMLGREARNIRVTYPMKNGVVEDFVTTIEMLTQLIRKARRGHSHFSRRAVINVLSGMSQVEQRALLDVAEHARIGRVWMIEEGLASALGAGIKPTDSGAAAIVDIGGGVTNVAVVSRGAIIHSQGERIGSSDINAALTDYIHRHRSLSVGPLSTERLKLELASATPPSDSAVEASVSGRDVQTGQPRAIELTAGEIYPVVKLVVERMFDVVRQALSELSPDVDADIYDRGIILTGGGALLSGLESCLMNLTGIPVRTAEEPHYATLRGLAQMLEEPFTFRRSIRGSKQLIWAGSGTL
jgi:rod shape-determining protein MreB and related proteins